MKKFGKILLLVAAIVGFASCHGQEDDGVQLQLVPSKRTMTADGVDVVTFEVLYGANVVTTEALIELVSPAEQIWGGRGVSTFTTTESGSYIFKATYLDLVSEEVEITAAPYVSNFLSRFDRHICVMDFTGAWCSFCPDGYRTLMGVINNPYAGFKDIVTVLALHDDTGGKDPMALGVTNAIHAAFGLGSYPAFLTDLRSGGLLTEGLEKIRESFYESLDEYPAQCDVKIVSSVEGDIATVEVTLFAELAGDYRVSVWLVENGVVGPQNDGASVYDSWNHEHVARALLSDNWRGDALGTLAKEQEQTKNYTYTLGVNWKVADMSVVALAITPDGYVNNVAECALGESVDYKYIAE
ncbi:MAG: Omp28-related outer membrane protein [Tidjanibacter sp.]|nr:Omp28-related outer membrane protein [Tidjanibacter sp.]